MKFVFYSFFWIMIASATAQTTASFEPPKGWQQADSSKTELPPLVKIMVVGKSEAGFPPSINLTTAKYDGTLTEYLDIVKKRPIQGRKEWKNLGYIQTKSGKASLSQSLSCNQWGEVKQLHMIFVQDSQVYILTAASLKSEFTKHYKNFYDAFTSFQLN